MKYDITPIETPEGCEEKWPGPWFKFERLDSFEGWGQAHWSMLASYVGVEEAKAAIEKCETS